MHKISEAFHIFLSEKFDNYGISEMDVDQVCFLYMIP